MPPSLGGEAAACTEATLSHVATATREPATPAASPAPINSSGAKAKVMAKAPL